MPIKGNIVKSLKKATKESSLLLEIPSEEGHGDYSSNISMQLFAKGEKDGFENPKEKAESIVKKLKEDDSLKDTVEKIEVAGPGFINFFLSQKALFENLEEILLEKENYGINSSFLNKKIMVEYAHPNTHKELHVGHMRTLILGEALSRLFSFCQGEVFRANYQGDIGLHVAKSVWGTKEILKNKNLSWEKAEKDLDLQEKAHLLGEGYVLGNKMYEKKKAEIDALNSSLYNKSSSDGDSYQLTRKWSLDYYGQFYKRFGTKFDKLYFESEVADKGKAIVENNIGKVFSRSEGAIIFDGEKYGLHKRVFITKDGNPTYEAKDMELAFSQFKDFPFDLNIHVVANEQTGYFKVIFKALELLDSKFKGREYHLPMGMVNLVGIKMSSRTGEILRVDELIEMVKKEVKSLVKKEIKNQKEIDKVSEIIALGAIKYSMLKVHPEMDVAFNVKTSIDLNGNSGPYLQYTYARCQSILKKAKEGKTTKKELNSEEENLLRSLIHFKDILEEASCGYSPNLLCSYLFDLAQKYNCFYTKHRIIGSENEDFRLKLTQGCAQVIKNGLYLLGIETPERM